MLRTVLIAPLHFTSVNCFLNQAMAGTKKLSVTIALTCSRSLRRCKSYMRSMRERLGAVVETETLSSLHEALACIEAEQALLDQRLQALHDQRVEDLIHEHKPER